MNKTTIYNIKMIKAGLKKTAFFNDKNNKIKFVIDMIDKTSSSNVNFDAYCNMIKNDPDLKRIASGIYINEDTFIYLEIINDIYILTNHINQRTEWKLVLNDVYKYNLRLMNEGLYYANIKIVSYESFLNLVNYISKGINTIGLPRVSIYSLGR